MRRNAVLNVREGGWTLLATLVIMLIVGSLMTFLLIQAQGQAQASRVRRESVQALYDAFGQLEMARVQICRADYDFFGRNKVVVEALESQDKKIPGTNVSIHALTGANGTWFLLTARSPYDDGHSERVVRRIFRDRDYFSSYNLFVAADPVGIAGSPVGAIHTNKQIQFYFPNGLYRHSVTAAGGSVFKAGATEENTRLVGPFNDHIDPINIDLEGDENFGFNALKRNVFEEYSFPADQDVKITLERQGGDQYLTFEAFTKPRIEYEAREVFDHWNYVNPHEVEEEVQEKVQVGTETKTRTVTVYEDVEVTVTRQVPVYRTETQYRDVPVYRQEERTREVPIWGKETRTRMVEKKVWVWDPIDLDGGTAVAGDGGRTGHWESEWVEETYEADVIVGYEQETYYVNVVDHYESQPYEVQVVDHYEEVEEQEIQKVAKEVEETYEEPVYEWVTKTVTKTVYDKEAVYKTVYDPVYIPREPIETKRLPAPENGVVYVGGDVIGIKGDVVGRLTIATEGKMLVTGSIVYRDEDGDPAYKNGDDPTQPYEPNPSYNNYATLGLIAKGDVIYTTEVPDNFEINGSIMSIRGRVGIDGIVLDDDGEIKRCNYILDEFGRKTNESFHKNSIRRLGGITTYRRPVDTVVANGTIQSGFKGGKSAFDTKILASPPPFFMARAIPRFFVTEIVK